MKPVLVIVRKCAFVLLLFAVACACTRQLPFNRERWNDESDRDTFHFRSAMLDDLLENHHLHGKSIAELKTLFGYIDYDSLTKPEEIVFEVEQEWEGIDPSYTKYLHLRLNAAERVDSVYLTEFQR